MHLHDLIKLICLELFVVSPSKILGVSNVSIEHPVATAIEGSRLYGNCDEWNSWECRTVVSGYPRFSS
jgi:hypothetical protein